MNERIKKLAEEAGFLTEDGNFYADSFDAINDEVEAFAELIVRECVRCVTQPTIQAEFPYDIAIREVQNVLANDMKFHFGVE